MINDKRLKFLLFGSLVLLFGNVQAQYTTPPPGVVPLNILWRVKLNSMDAMTTPYSNFGITGSANDGSYSNTPDFGGSVFYVPAATRTGTKPLYRLQKNGDRMDSTLTNEGGYTLEGAIGYPYTSSSEPGVGVTGQSDATKALFNTQFSGEIYRSLKVADHSIQRRGESLTGYTVEGSLGVYGYPRYTTFISGGNGEPLLYAQSKNADTIIKSHLAFGGVVWEWWCKGVQYINSAYGTGRQMQTSVVGSIYNSTDSQWYTINPTESGDDLSYFNVGNKASDWSSSLCHGSPLSSAYGEKNDGILDNSGVSRKQITISIPLEWNITNYPCGVSGGIKMDHPLLWRGWYTGKKVTLDYKQVSTNGAHYNIATYETYIGTPTGLSDCIRTSFSWETASNPASTNSGFTEKPRIYVHGNDGTSLAGKTEEKAEVEIPTVYLRANFSKFYTLDSKQYQDTGGVYGLTELSSTAVPNNAVADITNIQYSTYPYKPSTGYGGIIAVDPNTGDAMGLYGVNPSQGGSVAFFSMMKLIPSGNTDTSATSDACVKITAFYRNQGAANASTPTLGSGISVLKSWIITGKGAGVAVSNSNSGSLVGVRDVISAMQYLYTDGAKGPPSTSFSSAASY
jgi:hypothetical protein